MIASTSDVLGTVAVYYRSPRTPTAHELEVMSLLARTAALAVQSRRAEKAFRDFADTAPSMLWVTAPSGECTFLSRGWYEFSGQTEADAAGFAWLDAVHPEDRAQARARFRIAIEQQTTFALEHRVRRADGEYRWVIDAGRPRFGHHGTFLGHIGSVIDITERKAIEDKLREGDRRKDEFLATLAHELRNPLAPIRNGLEVMKRIPTDNRVLRQTRDMMDRQLSHMVRLIDDLLDVSRITRGMVELRRQLVSVKTVVDIALEATQAQMQGNAQQLTVKLPPEPLMLEADP